MQLCMQLDNKLMAMDREICVNPQFVQKVCEISIIFYIVFMSVQQTNIHSSPFFSGFLGLEHPKKLHLIFKCSLRVIEG